MKNSPLTIVADQNMPRVEELFSPFGEVLLLPGREITAADLHHADALLVRSVTQVNAELLDASPVRFVGSATIGTDHIDREYLRKKQIHFAHAPGCNAEAVVQYVLAALAVTRPDWRNRSVAIIGCGNVGGRLYRRLQALGVNCSACDPFLDADSGYRLVGLEQALQADIVCLHTPLTVDGPYPTKHMITAVQLKQLKPGSLLLNAGRGAVIDNGALLDYLADSPPVADVILDVWEGEPAIDRRLLPLLALATPHIAGYSDEGRLNGTSMVYRAFCRWLDHQHTPAITADPPVELPSGLSLNEAITASYNILEDHSRMIQMAASHADCEGLARGFDTLRRGYPGRREFSHYQVCAQSTDAHAMGQLGFAVGRSD